MKKDFIWLKYAENYKKDTYPGKPSPDDLDIFYKFIKKAIGKKKARILVLGATPGMRDVAAKFNSEITLIDNNKDVIKAMSKLIKHKKKEKKIVGNWLKMPFKDNYFDVVIGDLIIGNIHGEKNKDLIKEIYRILKPKGYWIHRVYVIENNLKRKNTEDMIKEFSKAIKKYKNIGLMDALIKNSYNPKTRFIYTSAIKKSLDKYGKNNKCIYPENKKIEKIMNKEYNLWSPFKVKWYVGTKKEVFSRLSKYFKVLRKGKTKDHYLPENYVVVMCRKN